MVVEMNAILLSEMKPNLLQYNLALLDDRDVELEQYESLFEMIEVYYYDYRSYLKMYMYESVAIFGA